MKTFFIVSAISFSAITFGFASFELAQAQSVSGSQANGMVQAPSVNVDSGINAHGSTSQQSPAADTSGTPVKLPPPSDAKSGNAVQADTPGSTNNALTKSPNGPGTGGNDATK